MSELARTVEALLFLSSQPLSVEALADAAEVSTEDIEQAISQLEERYGEEEGGLVLKRVGGGLLLATDPVAEHAAQRLFAKPRTAPLSQAQAETLATIAYLQPVSRPEIARIRGVNTDSASSSLLERGLIEEAGRSQFGAVLYRTSDLFLKLFGLQSLESLPDIQQWDPEPEAAAELRERLLKAGSARLGAVPQTELGSEGAVQSSGQFEVSSEEGPQVENEPEPEPQNGSSGESAASEDLA